MVVYGRDAMHCVSTMIMTMNDDDNDENNDENNDDDNDDDYRKFLSRNSWNLSLY